MTDNNDSNNNDREFNYVPEKEEERAIAKGGVSCPFPWRLHEMLKVTAEEGIDDIVSWVAHGRAFTVHKPKEFAKHVLSRFFSQSKYASFQRQLNLYGFNRFAQGPDKGAYYHLCFIKGHRSLVVNMVRRKIKGTRVRRVPTEEPNFYDPAWENHFEPTNPPGLKTTTTNNTFKVVSPSLGSTSSVSLSVPSDIMHALSPASSGVYDAAKLSDKDKLQHHHRHPSALSMASSTPAYVDISSAPPSGCGSQLIAQISDEESTWGSTSADLEALLDDDLLFLDGADGNPMGLFEGIDLSIMMEGEASTSQIWEESVAALSAAI